MNDPAPVKEVAALISESQQNQLHELLLGRSPSEVARVISRLDTDHRSRLLEILPDEAAASLVQSIPLALAGEVLREIQPAAAAAILNRLPSDDQTDLLASLGEPQSASVLALMAPAEADDVSRLSKFAADTAGGLMAAEFLAYPATFSVGRVVTDLRTKAAEYCQYPVQYVYALSSDGKLQGVVRLRDLLFHGDDVLLSHLSLRSPEALTSNARLSELRDFFERHRFFAAPVLDVNDRLIGVVTRADFEEANADQAAHALLRFGGILGEEFRSMPLLNRAGARLAWLAITMLLSFLAASVVGLFEETLAQVIALAVFLPVISGMSGNAGNQSIAVSMRELSLGLVKPQEMGWVFAKEIGVGLINGLTLGLVMAGVAVLWKQNVLLGIVVAVAQMLSMLLAACLGGVIPLLLKRLGFDPAVASAPLLTTLTDATGFFLTLGLASLCLAK